MTCSHNLCLTHVHHQELELIVVILPGNISSIPSPEMVPKDVGPKVST
jgi:hypothetical protein